MRGAMRHDPPPPAAEQPAPSAPSAPRLSAQEVIGELRQKAELDSTRITQLEVQISTRDHQITGLVASVAGLKASKLKQGEELSDLRKQLAVRSARKAEKNQKIAQRPDRVAELEQINKELRQQLADEQKVERRGLRKEATVRVANAGRLSAMQEAGRLRKQVEELGAEKKKAGRLLIERADRIAELESELRCLQPPVVQA